MSCTYKCKRDCILQIHDHSVIHCRFKTSFFFLLDIHPELNTLLRKLKKEKYLWQCISGWHTIKYQFSSLYLLNHYFSLVILHGWSDDINNTTKRTKTYFIRKKQYVVNSGKMHQYRCWVMVFNATFSTILFISLRSVLLMEETGVYGENNRTVVSHWQTSSHSVVPSILRY